MSRFFDGVGLWAYLIIAFGAILNQAPHYTLQSQTEKGGAVKQRTLFYGRTSLTVMGYNET